MSRVTDGTTNTIMLGEKFVCINYYKTAAQWGQQLVGPRQQLDYHPERHPSAATGSDLFVRRAGDSGPECRGAGDQRAVRPLGSRPAGQRRRVLRLLGLGASGRVQCGHDQRVGSPARYSVTPPLLQALSHRSDGQVVSLD